MWPATAAASGSARRLGHDDKGEFRHPRHVRGARRPEAPTGEREERLEYRATFHDIVPDERVVFSYHLTADDMRRWASLVTIELAPRDGGTSLRHTEQYVFLACTADGAHDTAHLQGGTRLQLNALAAALG
jgi:uncharacterized protein YndB with AHSA1/START domain